MTFKELNKKLSEDVKDILAKYVQKCDECLALLKEASDKIENMDASVRSTADKEFAMLIADIEDAYSFNDTCKIVVGNYLSEKEQAVCGNIGEIKKWYVQTKNWHYQERRKNHHS